MLLGVMCLLQFRRQSVYRATLREKGRQITVLGDLVPDGLLDDRPADHAGRFSESDGETSTFPARWVSPDRGKGRL